MTLPMTLLTVGASLGVGAVSVPVFASVLSKPITGAVVPTRITDLADYLTASGDKPRGLDGSAGFVDFENEQSVGSPDTAPTTIPTPNVGKPPSGGAVPPTGANSDNKRMLAIVSFAGGVVIAIVSFAVMRSVLR